MQLLDLGWNSFFEDQFEQYRNLHYSPMRIIRENREKYIAYSEAGELTCEISGKFRFDSEGKANFPTAGDWVAGIVRPGEMKGTIHALFSRKSVFSRKVAGQITDEQVVAANIDTIFIVTGLDLNYNVRRIERYLALAWNSGAVPVIILNKSDLCPEAEIRKSEVESIAFGVAIHTVSATRNIGIDSLYELIRPGETVAFLGSSGVGKSTMNFIFFPLCTMRFSTSRLTSFPGIPRHT